MPHGQFSLWGQPLTALLSSRGREVGLSSPAPHTRSESPKQWSLPHSRTPGPPPHWCLSSVPPLPLHSFLSQHPVACQECDATQNGQVLQSLEHVELSPVDIHESQHCWGKKNLKKIKKSPWLKLHFKDQPFVILRTTALPGLSIWFLSHLWSSEWQL